MDYRYIIFGMLAISAIAKVLRIIFLLFGPEEDEQ